MIICCHPERNYFDYSSHSVTIFSGAFTRTGGQSVKKHLANMITSLRIIGAVVLAFVDAKSNAFLIIYAFCGLTDAVDGFVARKLNIQSELGQKLDSVSDVTFYSVMLYKVWPLLAEAVPQSGRNIILSLIGARLVLYIVYALIYHKLLSTHSICNKIISIMAFFLPFALRGGYGKEYCYAAMAVALIAILDDIYGILKRAERNNDE